MVMQDEKGAEGIRREGRRKMKLRESKERNDRKEMKVDRWIKSEGVHTSCHGRSA